VFFDHPCVGMAKVMCNDKKRHAAHDRMTSPRVPEAMKWNGFQLGVLAGADHLTDLFGGSPFAFVIHFHRRGVAPLHPPLAFQVGPLNRAREPCTVRE